MEIRNLRVAVHNLGCKVNFYEAEAMLRELRDAGAAVVDWEEPADVYIINTCSVTNIADRKSRQMLHRVRAKNPAAVVVAAGCYVQAREEELKGDAAVDILIGNNRKSALVSILRNYRREDCAAARSFVPDLRSECAFERMEGGERSGRVRAFLKVQDGCNQFCSYCIIPYVRGRIRSRSMEDTMREARKLAAEGCREMVLTGIHLSSYGLDLERQSYEHAVRSAFPSERLLMLIQAVAAVPGVERVRLGSLEPRIITQDFVMALREIPALCPHFHLSLQSGSDRTLRAMNRHYDTAAFRESAHILRESFPEAALTTDVIVGFPGETDEDFKNSYDFIREMDFYELHVFKYSERKGTAAERMQGQLTEAVKAARSQQLLELEQECSERFRTRFLHREEKILLEELLTEEGRAYLTGLNRQYVRFRIPAECFPDASGQIGEIIRASGRKICKTYVLAKPV